MKRAGFCLSALIFFFALGVASAAQEPRAPITPLNRCEPGKVDCAGRCVDISRNRNNCGVCGQRCQKGSSCVNGACVAAAGTTGTTGSCAAGQVKCRSGCTDVNSDRRNCGTCGTLCRTGYACNNGMCSKRIAWVFDPDVRPERLAMPDIDVLAFQP